MPQIFITPSSPASHTRLEFLDGLRALAAMYVLVFHASSYQWSHLSGRGSHVLKPFLFGHEAVDLFIVLSGFSLMLPIVQGKGGLRSSARTFFKRRAWRILPPYYAALALCLVLDFTIISHKTGSPWDSTVPVSIAGVLAHLFLVQDVFPSTWSQINSPMWSISVEWRIYFCFPLLVLAWQQFGPWLTTGLVFVIAYAFNFALIDVPFLRQFNTQNNGITPQYLGLFALGMLGASVAFPRDQRITTLYQRIPWVGAAVLTSVLTIVGILADSHFRKDIFAGICAITVIITATLYDGYLRRFLSWRPLVRIGTFAYSFYLLHFAFLQIVWQYLFHPLHLYWQTEFAIHVLVGLPLAVGLSYLFFLVFERPFLLRRNSETPTEVTHAAALSPAP